MKVIVSHDVDHLYLTEHLFDGILLKYGFRAVMEWMNGVLPSKEFIVRLGDLFNKQWHHVDELMDFDDANGIPSTFFFGVRKGLGLNYSIEEVRPIIERVVSRGFEVGLHGMEYQDEIRMRDEFRKFERLAGNTDFGVRMHYLRKDDDTLKKLSDLGYGFDSTEFNVKSPYLIENMWEFPLHIMDTQEFYGGKKWQSEKIEDIIVKTQIQLEKIQNIGIEYLTLLFHDRYFCSSHQQYKQWYQTIVEFLKDKGHSFLSYQEAVRELR